MTDMILYIFVLVKSILKHIFHNNRFQFCKLNQSMQMNAQANIIIPPFINTGVMLVDKGNLSQEDFESLFMPYRMLWHNSVSGIKTPLYIY